MLATLLKNGSMNGVYMGLLIITFIEYDRRDEKKSKSLPDLINNTREEERE